jgi:hypothetical protein
LAISGNVLPALLFFKNRKLVDRILGLPSADVLKARLDFLAKVDAVPPLPSEREVQPPARQLNHGFDGFHGSLYPRDP